MKIIELTAENVKKIDLCRLKIIEEHIADSSAPDRNTTMDAIKWKKKQLAVEITNNLSIAGRKKDENS